MNIEKNLIEIKQNIERLNTLKEVKIVAATKYVGVNEIKTLFDLGVKCIGENKAMDFLTKYDELEDYPIEWHFIGSLQTNKVKKVINKIAYLHSLDRASLASEINKYREEVLPCFVEVNCSMEESKHGIKIEEVKSFIYSLEKYAKIRIIGLMTMAMNTNDESQIESTFLKLAHLKEEIRELNLPYAPCTELSMGMSNDYHIAIKCGATVIRIGSSLFK